MSEVALAGAGGRFLSARTIGFFVVAALIVAGQAGTRAGAADLVADLPIDEVTVYQEGAMVQRRSPLSIAAGEQHLIVRGLPASLEESALRVSVGSAAVSLGAVELRKITQSDYVGESERTLRSRLEALNDQRGAADDEIATAQTQLKLLESLASQPSGSSTRPAVDSASLSAVLATVGTGGTNARARIREAGVRRRQLDAQIAVVQAELKKIATAQKESSEVRAVLIASQAVTAPVTVEYSVEDAGWHSIYEARLDTGKKHLDLVRQAAVQQGTGEDWSGVSLVLTLARPEENLATPVVEPAFVRVQPPAPPPPQTAHAKAAAPVQLEEVSVSGTRRNAAEIATEYATEYRVSGRVTLLSDREPHLYPIGEDGFAVEVVLRAAPAVSASAFVEAASKFEREIPWGAGELHVYRDGALVGTTSVPGLMPGADVRLPFGADRRIRLIAHELPEQSGARGLFGGQQVEEHRHDFELTSFHTTPVVLELVDRVPVSQDAAVKVELLKGATAATTRDLDGKAGVMLWKLTLSPREKTVVRHYYSVAYPKGQVLTESGGD
jgi:uncharacterized protein (TIGR02231 family)